MRACDFLGKSFQKLELDQDKTDATERITTPHSRVVLEFYVDYSFCTIGVNNFITRIKNVKTRFYDK